MNRSKLTGPEIRVLYEGGSSCPRIAEVAGVTETAIRRRLYRMGVRLRTPQDYPAHVDAAHAARRSTPDPLSARVARARTREMLMLGTSALEDMLAEELTTLSEPFVRQKAIGPYNVDFAFPAAMLVVEVSGGGHNPRVYRNRDGRRAFLEENGWTVLEVNARTPHWTAKAVGAVIGRLAVLAGARALQ